MQIDKVGVYSFTSHIICQNNDNFPENINEACCLCTNSRKNGKNEHKVNVIVNINTEGIQKGISFESQLLIANNLLKPITLVFHHKKINK
jgi:hypothetical protein